MCTANQRICLGCSSNLLTLLRRSAAAVAAVRRCARHSWAKLQKPAKNVILKIVKLTDHTCACNDLTNFECESQATGNGRCENFQKLAWKHLVKSSWANLFFGGFLAFLEPLCARRRTLQGRPWPNSAVLLTVVLVVYYKYNDPGLELQLYTTSTIHTI